MSLEMLTEMFSKENIKACGSHLWTFFKKFYVTGFFYCLCGGIAYIVAALFPVLLKHIGVSSDYCIIIMQILLTVAPALSILGLSLIKKEDEHNEISMEIGFSAWIVTAVYVWVFF